MSNPWFRLYAEFATDPKVQILSEQDQRRLIMIFCMRCNGDVTLQDKHVTFQLRITPEEWAISKGVFIDAGFIDSDNNVLNWDKRQYVSDSSAARVARHRTLHKHIAVTPCNVTVTPPEQNRTDTEQIQSKSKPLSEYSDEFDFAWQEYPKRSGANKKETYKAWNARLKKGASTDDMISGAIRYAAYCKALNTDPSYIKLPSTFFGPAEHYLLDWKITAAKLSTQDSLKRTGDLLTGRIRQDDTITIDVD